VNFTTKEQVKKKGNTKGLSAMIDPKFLESIGTGLKNICEGFPAHQRLGSFMKQPSNRGRPSARATMRMSGMSDSSGGIKALFQPEVSSE
jgi:hypothetical protein